MPMGLVLRTELEYRSAISGPTRRLAQAARHDNWCAAPDHFKGGFARLNVSTAIFQLAPALRHKMTYFPSAKHGSEFPSRRGSVHASSGLGRAAGGGTRQALVAEYRGAFTSGQKSCSKRPTQIYSRGRVD